MCFASRRSPDGQVLDAVAHYTATNRASRTAVCPRLGRRLGMTSRQSSYGVRISAVAVERDQRVAPSDHIAAAIRLHEGEAAGGRRHRHRDLGEALLPPVRRRQRRVIGRHIEMTQQSRDARQHRVDGRLLPVLTRLHQAGGTRRRRIGEARIVDQPPPARVAMVGHHQSPARPRRAQAACPSATCRTGSADPTATASSAGRTAHPPCRSAAGSRAPGQARSERRALSSTAASHTRLMSSSTKRDAVGWRGSNRSIRGEVDEPERQLAARRRAARRAAAGPARSRRRSRCRAKSPAARHAARPRPNRAS